MKTPTNARTNHHATSQTGQRRASVRAHIARAFEYRAERRKIHARLRRLDMALNGENEVFA